VSLDCHPIRDGAILLRDGKPGPEQAAFAAWLTADPDCTVVICDLPEEYPEEAWDRVIEALAATTGSLRLLPWQFHSAGLLPVGEALGTRLARVVIAADGHPVTAAGGGLFIPPEAGTGWYRTKPGRLPRRDSRRFPRPKWTDWAPLENLIALSTATVLRPLPGGAWLSPAGSTAAAGSHWGRDHIQWLYHNVPWSHGTIKVILGQPGAPPVPVADIAKLWATLPVKARQCVQFVPYGAPGPSRQELADALGDRVTVAAPLSGALPQPTELSAPAQPFAGAQDVSRPAALPAVTVTSHSERRRLPAIRLESGPPASGVRRRAATPSAEPAQGAATPPDVVADRPQEPAAVREPESGTGDTAQPIAMGAGRSPIRYASAGAAAAAFPARAPEPPVPPVSPSGHEVLTPISLLGRRAAPMAVEPAAAAPEPVVSASVSAVPASEPAVPAPVPKPPAPASGVVRVQPVPAQDASAAYLDGGLEEERQWLQRSLSRQFSAAASSVARVLSRSPRLRGDGQEVVADLVAVRLYLTEYGQRLDDDVRTGQPGSHVPFARCVNAGLRRLPSHRGAVRLRAMLSDAELDWYASQQLVTEWAFCPALTDGGAELPGNVDFLIWSATARRTSALVPEVSGQVVFLPSTRFKVLEVRDEERRTVLLRELSAREAEPSGAGMAPLDESALTGLEKASVAWSGTRPGTALPQEYARRFCSPPGLLRNLAESPVA
jgi:hypothetical protein